MLSRPATARITPPAVILALVAGLLAGCPPANAVVSDTARWTLDGTQLGAELAGAVCTVGDVNGDGYFDVIVGEPYYDGASAQDGGRARVS